MADEKIAAIESVLDRAQASSKESISASQALKDTLQEYKDTKDQIDQIKVNANQVLGLSSQAGLASYYLQESKKLTTRSYVYTGILYATSIIAASIAAFYVLPSLEHSFSNSAGGIIEKAMPLTLLRATVLAPLVYVIYFTTKQISSLELLRMDYAEKAAASLAYSGYKGEMTEDAVLLERLRGSLLLKFAEHPERLLRKNPGSEKIEVEVPGFKASSASFNAKPEDSENNRGE